MAHRTFHWTACAEELAAFVSRADLEVDEKRRAFVGPSLRVAPPLVLPIPPDCRTIADYLDTLPAEPARQTVLVMQAGAVSLGLFEAGEPVATKTFKRYVVRGKGRAQPTHLDTKGKSRYGSRLRLQNARLLLEETNEKLREWRDEFGPSRHVFVNAPKRMFADLFAAKPEPPFEREEAIRIPLDLARPTTDVLLRAYKSMSHGRIDEVG